ncbi:MAG: DNA-binding protein WhiA [Bacilli bacterium]|nr:DNA-binding protein WhiA [Bacilli bacterium]
MKDTNSFAKTVKEEIVSQNYQDDRLLAILSSFTRVNGSLLIKHKKMSVQLRIENSKIAKFIYAAFQRIFQIKPNISYLKKNNLNKNTCYLINLDDEKILEKLHINFLGNKVDNYFAGNKEKISGYLAGSFLASGSVNSPRSSNYHLEVSLNDYEYAKSFVSLVKKYKEVVFNLKITKRRDKYIVYLKRSDQIVNFLVLIGATNACLYFEDTRVGRDFDNMTNRLSNLDTANYQKTIKAAKNDIKIINKLIKKNGLANLGNDKVILLATLRIKYPDDTLENLAEKMSDELGDVVTKSNINHILRAFREEGKNL